MNIRGTAFFSNSHLMAALCCSYKLDQWIGKGTYGDVRLLWKHNKQFAGKFIAVDEMEAWEMIAREVSILASIKHPNVINIVDLDWNPTLVCIITTAMDTTLSAIIGNGQSLTHDHYRRLVSQIVCGVAQLHRNNVMHRDIKPANILVNADCSVKICDFGLARYTDGRTYTTGVVTMWYRAPELLNHVKHVFSSKGKYTKAIDIWAMGCVFSELLIKSPLFPECNEACTLYAHKQMFMAADSRSTLQNVFDVHCVKSGITKLISEMLRMRASDRISAENALLHPSISLVARVTNLKIENNRMRWNNSDTERIQHLGTFCAAVKSTI